MEFIHKIRALQIGKRKTFRRVLLAEILLILLGIVGLFGRKEVYEYPSEGVTVNTGYSLAVIVSLPLAKNLPLS